MGLSGFLGAATLPNVDQIGAVVRNLDAAIEEMSALGVGPWYRMSSKVAEAEIHGQPEHVVLRIGMAMLGNVQLELIEPVEGRSIHQDFLDSKGEGLHHIGFVVADFDERVAAMTARGVPIIYARREEGRLVFAYLDASPSTGILLELIRPIPRFEEIFERVRNLSKERRGSESHAKSADAY